MVMTLGSALAALARGARLGVCASGAVRILRVGETKRAVTALRALQHGRRGPLLAVKRCRCKYCSQRRQRHLQRRKARGRKRHKCVCPSLRPPVTPVASRGVQTDTESLISEAPLRRPIAIQTDAPLARPTARQDKVSPLPPKNRRRSPVPPPPKFICEASLSPSPPKVTRRDSVSPPPSKRRRRSSSSSPPKVTRHDSVSPSPPKTRRRSPVPPPPKRRRSSSSSPPKATRRVSFSPPPSKARRRSPSHSPPKTRRPASPSHSPPRNRRRSPSHSPPRNRRRSPSSPPPKTSRRGTSLTPPRTSSESSEAVRVAEEGGALELVVSESEVRLAGAALAAAGAADGTRWARDPTYRRQALYRLQPLVRVPRAPVVYKPSRPRRAVFRPLGPPPRARPGAAPGRAYSALEDQAIVAWLSANESRERAVNGNRIWRELQDQHTGLTGVERSWHSLRNRYLRYLLPSLGDLAIPPDHAQRLRAAAAMGEIKRRTKPSRRPSILKASGPLGASARRPGPPPPPPPEGPTASSSDEDFTVKPKRHSRPLLSDSPPPSPRRTRDTHDTRAPRETRNSRGLRDTRSPHDTRGLPDTHSPNKGRETRRALDTREPPLYSELTARYALRRSTSSVPTPPPESPHKRRLYNPRL